MTFHGNSLLLLASTTDNEDTNDVSLLPSSPEEEDFTPLSKLPDILPDDDHTLASNVNTPPSTPIAHNTITTSNA
eukprot:15287337-Ditylum_brightwellii.AAC.1